MNSLKLMRVEHQYKFNNSKEAVKEANAIAQYISRYAKRHNISCKAVVCVSEHNIGSAFPYLKKNGRRGRPKIVFMDKFRVGKVAPTIAPHLHILLNSDRADLVTSMIVHNINERHRKRHPNMKKSVVSRRYPVFTPEKYIGYVMHQKSGVRFVEHDEKGILRWFDFQAEYEKYKPLLF